MVMPDKLSVGKGLYESVVQLEADSIRDALDQLEKSKLRVVSLKVRVLPPIEILEDEEDDE